MKRLILSPRARWDLDMYFLWYMDKAGMNTAIRFQDAARMALDRVAELPSIGAPCIGGAPRLRGHRSWPVPGFEAIRIYYLEKDLSIDIMRVLHGAQDIDQVFETAHPYGSAIAV
jgi:toxin ParE1/3/4